MADLFWHNRDDLAKNGTQSEADNGNSSDNLIYIYDQLEVFGPIGQAILIFIYTFASVLALTGNTLVILVELYGRRSAKNLRKFLINLAISDLLMGVISAPFVYTDILLGRWIFPPGLCPLGQFVQLLSVFVSTFTMTFIGIERYFATLHPISATNTWLRSHCNLVLQLGWLLGILHALTYWDTTKVVEFQHHNVTYIDCYHESGKQIKLRMTISFVLTFVLPMIFLTVSYGAIGRRLFRAQQYWCSYKRPSHLTEPSDSQSSCKAAPTQPFPQTSSHHSSISSSAGNSTAAKTIKQSSKAVNASNKSLFVRSKASRQSFKFKGRTEVMSWSVPACQHDCIQAIPTRHSDTDANTKTSKVFIQCDRRSSEVLNKMRVFRLLVAVLVLFLICWLPIKIFMLLLAYWPSFVDANTAFNLYAYYIAYFVCHWLSISNSFVNPILYCFYSQSFRADLIDLLVCVCNKLRKGSEEDEQQARLKRYQLTYSHYRHSSLNRAQKGNLNHQPCEMIYTKPSSVRLSNEVDIVSIHEREPLSHSSCSSVSNTSKKKAHFKLSPYLNHYSQETEYEVMKRMEKIKLQSF